MKKAVIFDLDGTLLNSIIDIAESMNEVLEKNNFPTHTIDEYKFIIGKGIDNLAIDSLPNNVSKVDYPKYCAEIREVYDKRWMLKTKPYDGIKELLNELTVKKIKIAILSNKPQNYTELVVKHLLPAWEFDCVLGSREGVPIKPNPQAVIEIIEKFDLVPADFLYVGDTNIDMQTANAANLTAIGVSWGFRPVKELLAANANYIIDKPMDLLNLLTS